MSDNTPPGDLPSAELRAFIYSCIDDVEQVQILALLSESDQARSARRVAAEASLADSAARHHLESLAARGLVSITVGQELTYRYAPKTANLRRYGDELVTLYRRAPLAILRLVATNLRPSVKRIADAFRLRDRE